MKTKPVKARVMWAHPENKNAWIAPIRPNDGSRAMPVLVIPYTKEAYGRMVEQGAKAAYMEYCRQNRITAKWSELCEGRRQLFWHPYPRAFLAALNIKEPKK